MINQTFMSNYYRVASINQSLNKFIREATITKIQINAALKSSLINSMGIGNKVDLYA